MDIFTFDNYSMDYSTGEAIFRYHYRDISYTEKVQFTISTTVTPEVKGVVQQALNLCHMLIGTSYYKAFPTSTVSYPYAMFEDQAQFFNAVYQEGLSQFAYENSLTRSSLAHFTSTGISLMDVPPYRGQGTLCLQSGGKDSLLTATLLQEVGHSFTPWSITGGDSYPSVLDELPKPPIITRRTIDHAALKSAAKSGGLNGHVPITYIVQSLALVQALLLNFNRIIVSVGHEGAEPHAHIGDLLVNHQWSKTWEAEQALATYVRRYLSGYHNNVQIGSPLRQFSELRIAELFVKHCWKQFGQKFSSCNVANYRQNANNSQLKWCGNCPKCANSYLLFAPFLPPSELQSLFEGRDLFTSPDLEEIFKGLLGIDGVMKPFECVGEVEELRTAYHLALENGYQKLPFDVPAPASSYDYTAKYPSQPSLVNILQGVEGE